MDRLGRATVFAVVGSVQAVPALAATRPETFGPGKVACKFVGAGRFDCLLTSLRIPVSSNGVATFSLATLPPAERAAFHRWCFTMADDCTVQLQGVRQAPGSDRLSVVTSVTWTRLRPPKDQAAARDAAR